MNKEHHCLRIDEILNHEIKQLENGLWVLLVSFNDEVAQRLDASVIEYCPYCGVHFVK